MANSTPLLKYEATSEIKLKCKIDLDQLLPTQVERQRFDDKWAAFLASDPCNPKIFKVEKHFLKYKSEQLIPKKKDNRPPLLLVLGNPASHSVHAGMFFSFEKNRKEHRFWKNILKPAGILDLPEVSSGSIEKMNHRRLEQLWTSITKAPLGSDCVCSSPCPVRRAENGVGWPAFKSSWASGPSDGSKLKRLNESIPALKISWVPKAVW